MGVYRINYKATNGKYEYLLVVEDCLANTIERLQEMGNRITKVVLTEGR